jgi:site-specific DNA-methyltransferase (adenine-specific)
MLNTLQGIRRVLKKNGVAVVIIGDVANPREEPLPLSQGLWMDLEAQTGLELLELIEDELPAQNKVSRIWGETKGRATDRDCALVLASQDGNPNPAVDEVDWEDRRPCMAPPDAARDRLKDMRVVS